jgi:fatty-acyl-CoA synthase/long-chain acyl-CoA synthetase
LRLIQDEKITWLWAVPTMIYRMLDSGKVKDYDLSSLRTIVYGAAPISPARLREAVEVFGNIFIQLYGQVEVPQLITVLTKDDHAIGIAGKEKILRSAGRASLMADVRIVDREGRVLKQGEIGIIAAKTPYNMKGYWKNEEETAKTVKGEWILTGDVGYMDEEGYLYLVDREKDMIVSGGYNVYSTKVENVISQHPAVSNVAVIATPHPEWGEAVTAVIQLKPGMEVTEEEIIEFCRAKLARYEVPKRVEFADSLPLTPLGKVNKRELREKYWKSAE